MDNKKININLEGVPQTLLMPLLGRAQFSQLSYSPLHDEKAVELVNSINYDFEKLSKDVKSATLFWLARAYHFDAAINEYLQTHPNGIIVNLGAGLETAFYRVDNGSLSWVDLDLPEVISLREKLLTTTDRNHTITKSVMDFSWMDSLKELGNEFFFFAGGLLVYFTENEVKSLLTEIAKRFPKSELIFDTISSKGIYYANKMMQKANMSSAVLKWGLDDPKILESWSSHIKIKKIIPYFEKIKNLSDIPFTLRAKMYFYNLYSKRGIIHLEFY